MEFKISIDVKNIFDGVLILKKYVFIYKFQITIR